MLIFPPKYQSHSTTFFYVRSKRTKFFRQIKAVQKLASFEIQSLKEEVRRNRKTSKMEKFVKQTGSILMCYGIITLPLSIAMIVIGDQYNTLDSCSIQISQVLEVMGGLMLFLAILYIIVGLAFGTEANVECGTLWAIVDVTGLAQFGVLIWASVVVFGAYKTWEYEDNSSENFCEYTPFMFAFVILIIKDLELGCPKYSKH